MVFFVISLLVLFFNVRVPNELKGFLFFVQVSLIVTLEYTEVTCKVPQVVGFVYERSDRIDWVSKLHSGLVQNTMQAGYACVLHAPHNVRDARTEWISILGICFASNTHSPLVSR